MSTDDDWIENSQPGRVLDLPYRTAKHRQLGVAAITDNGIPVGELVHILESYHPFIDLAKIGVGSAYLEPRLRKKLQLYSDKRYSAAVLRKYPVWSFRNE